MKTITLFDTNFAHHNSDIEKGPCSISSFPGFDRLSSKFKWSRDSNDIKDVCVFTDNCLDVANTIYCDKKIAWILEPRELVPSVYENLNVRDFSFVFTHDEKLLRENYLRTDVQFMYYVYGGTWIKDSDFNIYEKSKKISTICSFKRQTSGQNLRHEVINRFTDKYGIDPLGNGYNPIKNKLDGLKDYRFSIVIENSFDGFITEKLLDCFLTGTVPIYKGANERVKQIFHKNGILFFENLEELEAILNDINKDEIGMYESKKLSINLNMYEAKKYIVCEDNLDVLWK